MNKSEEFAIKLEAVRRFMSKADLDGLVLSRAENFSWLGCGANNMVNNAAETGVAGLVVTSGTAQLITNNIEADRMAVEEVPELPLDEALVFPWHEPVRRTEVVLQAAKGKAFAADDAVAGLPGLPADFNALRYSLLPSELERYRALGADVAQAMEAAAWSVERGMNEQDVAAHIEFQMQQRAVSPIVLLVAADERIKRWRHPIVKAAVVDRIAMLVACGRRHGMICAITRLVHFGELPSDLQRRHDAVVRVDGAMMGATVPGAKAARIFEVAQTAYADNGYPGEWRYHHQGGATGYMGREWIATPSCEAGVLEDQPFAWNPSICGTKSEDTVLATSDGIEPITGPCEDWPVVEVPVDGHTLRRPDILIK